MSPSSFSLGRISVVLVGTSHPGNVGAAARAMKTMGLGDLRLAAPRFTDAAARPEAVAFASGATDVLAAATVHDSLAAAIADASLAIAVSAAPREFGPPPLLPEDGAIVALAELAADRANRVAFVFGGERSGLSTEEVQRCQRLVSIPTEPVQSSLNLAQAVQVIAYVLRRAAGAPAAACCADGGGAGRADGADGADGAVRFADQRALDGFFGHLEQALLAIGYLDPRHPKKLMPRLRRLFARARLEAEEVDLLRGMCKLVLRTAARAGGAQPGGSPGPGDRP